MKFLTPAAFSSRVGVPESTVRALCARGELPGAYRVGSRWRIDFDEFRAGARPDPRPAPRSRRLAAPGTLAALADALR